MKNDGCACGCGMAASDSKLGTIGLDGKNYRGICAVGILYQRSETLKFYAEPKNWSGESYRDGAPALLDQGAQARAALDR